MSGSDVVRLPGGKSMTRARARALGYLDENGEVKADLRLDQRSEAQRAREKRQAEWRKSQGLDGPEEPKIVLRPGNVDRDGAVITDPETLAAIAERTAQIEAEKAAEAATADTIASLTEVIETDLETLTADLEVIREVATGDQIDFVSTVEDALATGDDSDVVENPAEEEEGDGDVGSE